jgi:hypothetical protein
MTRTVRIYALAVFIAIVTTACGNAGDPPAAGAPSAERPPVRGERPPVRVPSAPFPPRDNAPDPAPRDPPIRDRFDEVDAALGELARGNVAFNTPERMRFRETRTITLIASPAMHAESLGEELRERIGGGDAISVEALQIAPLMEARLDGAPGLEVRPLTAARQPVGRAEPTEWRWSVQANEAGTQVLHLTIDAIVTVDGERFPRSLNVLDREIEVEITPGQQVGRFVESSWQWMVGTIVIPLGVWWWTNRRKRRRRS